jgi:aldehyde:ferredoxin oxidoreductase
VNDVQSSKIIQGENMTEYGYTGKILKVDLSSGKTSMLPTADFTERFVGGLGLAAKLYWDLVNFQVRAYDPENCLIFVTGPVTGFTGLAGSRWQVCGKSPAMDPEVFSHANLGERWGYLLKYAGYDALVIQGQAAKPSYLYIHDGSVEIRDASSLWGKSSFEAADGLKTELGPGTGILTTGPAAENLVTFATLLTDDGASGASGMGGVMGSKRLKAVAVAGDQKPVAADPDRLANLKARILPLRKDTWKGYLLDIPGRVRLRACNGCGIGCWRKSYEAEGGRRFKFFCQSSAFYLKKAQAYNPEWVEVTLQATRACDRYGLDTTVIQPMIDWLEGCYREGLLREETSSLPLSKIGSAEFIETLTRKIAFREDFGDILASGMLKAAARMGKKEQSILNHCILTRANETRDYDPRLILTNAILYATEPRRPINEIHELSHAMEAWQHWKLKKEDAFLSYDDLLVVAKNFWGSAAAADFTSYAGKALAAKEIQDHTYAKECLILCDFLWPIIWVRFAADHTGDPTMESQVLSAITGRNIDKAGLDHIGERVFNLQRALMLRQGWGGRRGDRLLDYLHDEPLQPTHLLRNLNVPGPNGEPVSREGAQIDRVDFEKLKDEYYQLRGWDISTGFPTEKGFQKLGLEDVAIDLKSRGLLA